ncbi:MAG: hypothetical protein QOH93_2864 [Chloroflexia bacterium]|jgi:hypothetical protein|nr:hypothetical protein [Chloroflexia bacterium]
MEINLGDEKIIELVSPYSPSEIHERMIGKKMDAFGAVAKLMQRPKWDEIVISGSQVRYEPFWYGSAMAHYSYDRRHRYTVEVAPEVQSVTIHAEEHAVRRERTSSFSLDAMEHCVEEIRRELMLDPVRGDDKDYSKYVAAPNKREVPSLEALEEAGAVVVPPEVRSSFLVRRLIQSLVKTFQADQVNEERIDIDYIYLYFRPVYAFEFHWTTRDKRAVWEFDAVTGETRTEGGQIKRQVASVLANDALFDVGSDAIGTIVPGAGVAVKLGRLAARKALG